MVRKREINMVKILVVEDEKALNYALCSILKENGFETESCYDGKKALEALEKNNYDLILTDVMMPKIDGFSLAKEIRKSNLQIPIIFMTALDDKPSEKQGFEIGIDDYIVKPFDTDILVLRIKSLLRRVNIEKSRELVVGNLYMNKDEHMATIDGKEILLTVREFNLLFKLLSFPKHTFTRNQLMEEFWDYDSSATSRTVDVYMARIREKTSSCNGFEILTVHGLGYKAVLK